MFAYAKKWLITILVRLELISTYKLNFIIELFAPLFVLVFVKLSIWYSVYNGQHDLILNHYTLADMIQYQVGVFIFSILIGGNSTIALSEDIRLGRVTSFLLYPFSLWEHFTATYISDRLFRLLLIAITLTLAYLAVPSWGIPHFSFLSLCIALLFSVGAGMLWYSIGFIIGLLAFWLDELWTLHVIMTTLAQFLSGATIPLSFYPPWLQSALHYLPFSLLASTPVRIFIGKPVNLTYQLTLLVVWLCLLQGLVYFTWKKGIKNYSAAGI